MRQDPRLTAAAFATSAFLAAAAPLARAADGPKKPSPIAVRVAVVAAERRPRLVYAIAPLAGTKQASVYARAPGRVTFLGPKEGDRVKAGDVLFRVDRSDPGESYLNQPALSPISGWVGQWFVDNVGAQVTAVDPVATIVDDSSLRAVVYLPTDDWAEVTADTKVTAAVGDASVPAKVERIARSADLASGRGSVAVTLANAKDAWRSGLYARFRFEVRPVDRIVAPSSAVLITDQGAYVYTVDGDHAKRTAVKFRIMDSDTVEILDGLAPQARLIVAGGNLLRDGSPVKILE